MSQEKEVVKQEENEGDQGLTQAEQKLSKGQKKKLREKKKKEQQARIKAELEDNGEIKTEESQKVEHKKEPEKTKKGKGAPKMNAAALLAIKQKAKQQEFQKQQEQKRIAFQKEQDRLIQLQKQKKQKLQDQEKERAERARAQIKQAKKKGTYVKKKDQQKLQRRRNQIQNAQKQQITKQQEQQHQPTQEQIREHLERQQKKKRDQSKWMKDDKIFFARKEGDFRSIVCCILGHVDTGKTTLLDKIRKTNVQEGQAGGITQQIGATFFPQQKLEKEINKCQSFFVNDVSVPGLLIIDTPGHESFANLRLRGSSLADIAILVIDVQHGLEKQTLESLELLMKRKTPFVIALNKIDRSYGWKPIIDGSSYLTLREQSAESLHDYNTKMRKVILQLNEKGYNVALYWQNPDPQDYISIIPTSGITGQGIPDILSVIVKYSTTIHSIKKRIKVKKDKFNCTVMEVKMTQGYGTTLDCLLVDGQVKKDDQVVLLGFDGPIVAKIKAILTPHPMKEMRVKDEYLHHKQIWGANGIKLAGVGLDNAVAGSPLIVVHNQDQIIDAKVICENQFDSVKKKIKLDAMGVGVAASTLGSLEALLEYLAHQKIPVSYVSVGPVSKEDVMKAMKSTLSQIPQKRKKQYGCLLVFDIKVLQDAQKFAQQNDIRIFTANIIYHLTDMFTKYVQQIKQERRIKEGKEAVFPCIFKQVATFRKSDPIVVGVDIQMGVLKVGTPITVYREGQKGDKQIKIGVVQSIEHNHKKLSQARKKTGSVAISIGGDPSIQAGKQFQQKDRLVSLLTRRSIDCLKTHYRQAVSKQEWNIVIQLKKYFNIH